MHHIIRALQNDDYAQWLALWDANNQEQSDPAVTEETWARICNPAYPVFGLGAWEDDALVGILHYVVHPTTGSVAPVAYMQDLYVGPAFRNQGIAQDLVRALSNEAKEKGLARVYWLAEANNDAARALYSKLGVRLDFALYVMPLKT